MEGGDGELSYRAPHITETELGKQRLKGLILFCLGFLIVIAFVFGMLKLQSLPQPPPPPVKRTYFKKCVSKTGEQGNCVVKNIGYHITQGATDALKEGAKKRLQKLRSKFRGPKNRKP